MEAMITPLRVLRFREKKQGKRERERIVIREFVQEEGSLSLTATSLSIGGAFFLFFVTFWLICGSSSYALTAARRTLVTDKGSRK